MTGRMRWERVQIALTTTRGPQQVQADTYGDWAVHLPLHSSDALSIAWAVAHVPTGLAIGSGFPKPEARKLCERLHKIVGSHPITPVGLKPLPSNIAAQVRAAVQEAYGTPTKAVSEPRQADRTIGRARGAGR